MPAGRYHFRYGSAFSFRFRRAGTLKRGLLPQVIIRVATSGLRPGVYVDRITNKSVPWIVAARSLIAKSGKARHEQFRLLIWNHKRGRRNYNRGVSYKQIDNRHDELNNCSRHSGNNLVERKRKIRAQG